MRPKTLTEHRPLEIGKGLLIGAVCSFLLGMIALGREYSVFTIMPMFLTLLLALAVLRRGHNWIALGVLAGTVVESIVRISYYSAVGL